MIDPVRLFHPSKSDRVAIVTVESASGKADQFVVNVARGKKKNALTDAKMFGPFTSDEIAKAHKSVVDGLLGEGYVAGGLGQLLLALGEKNPKVRARAAQRLGWRREQGAVEPLLKLLEKPKDDVSTVIEALGQIGDLRAVPAIRGEAEKKLLSRRRAGVEALLLLDDKPGLDAAKQRALERLPDELRAKIGSTSATLNQAMANVDGKERGIAADTLYELGALLGDASDKRACVEAALSTFTSATIHTPFNWRYAKSMWKRAMTRRDYASFGKLAHQIEIAARSAKSETHTLKSGYDGETKKTRLFSKSTTNYARRRGWRYLRRLAKHRPDEYALAAAEAVVPYVDGDDVMKGNSPSTGRSYLLHRVILGGTERYVFDGRQMRFKTKAGAKGKATAVTTTPGMREEAYPELWDRTPRAYVRLLGAAKHSLVQKFALDGILRHPEALASASHAECAALIESDDARIVDIGLKELRRRFDPSKPDFQLVLELAGSQKDLVRNFGLVWLGDTAQSWCRDREWIAKFLAMPHAASRDSAARLANASIRTTLPPEERRRLAADLLNRIEQKEPEEGAFSGFGAVLRDGLLEEAAAACPIARAVAMVRGSLPGGGNDAAIAVGASILAKKPGALDVIGFSDVVALANHEKAAVRVAAMKLLEGAHDDLAKDPSTLFSLIESDWDEVRTAALSMLDKIDLLPLGIDGLMGLADSTRVDVQVKAHTVLENAISRGVDVHEVLARLGQHPSPVTRKYAVGMAVEHLKPGFVRLAKLELLFRASLFDTWPDRKLKRTVIEFLSQRGQQDENQAEVAAQILGDFVRSQTIDDKERALAALVSIKLKFPQIEVRGLKVSA
jgi:hypothetical protein